MRNPAATALAAGWALVLFAGLVPLPEKPKGALLLTAIACFGSFLGFRHRRL